MRKGVWVTPILKLYRISTGLEPSIWTHAVVGLAAVCSRNWCRVGVVALVLYLALRRVLSRLHCCKRHCCLTFLQSMSHTCSEVEVEILKSEYGWAPGCTAPVVSSLNATRVKSMHCSETQWDWHKYLFVQCVSFCWKMKKMPFRCHSTWNGYVELIHTYAWMNEYASFTIYCRFYNKQALKPW